MKKLIGGLAVLSFAAFAFTASAEGTPNQNSCFGQDRAAYFRSQDGTQKGHVLADRAGDNAQINHDYMTACRAL